jgi:glycerol-3-phosphate O-acyltransferase
VERALEIRDLLKFEFFFSSTDDFIRDVEAEIDRYTDSAPDAEDILGFDLESFHPKSPIVLAPFFEAYFVVAAALMAENADHVTESLLAERALRMGDQLASHGDISNKEAVSSALFSTGTKLALSRGLLNGSQQEREDFFAELKELLETLAAINTWTTT